MVAFPGDVGGAFSSAVAAVARQAGTHAAGGHGGHEVALVCSDPIPSCILQAVADCSPERENCSEVITPLIFPFFAIVIGCLAQPLTKFVKLPYTLFLLFAGFLIGLVGCKAHLGYLTPSLQQWIHLRPPNLFFYIFLAPLIFEAAFVTQWHIFKRLLIPILTAAFIIVLLQTGLIAGFTWGVVDQAQGWSIWSALMFGAMLSATDPISVTATLKALGASENLGTLIEGESLVNDGSAFALWETFFHNSEYLNDKSQQYSVGGIVVVILRASVGGMLLGVLFALVALAILTYVYDEYEVETSLTVVVAFLGFWAAQSPAKLSGVICNVASGLVLSAYGRPLVSKSVRHGLDEFWHLFGWIANTIVFIHAGIITVAFVWPCTASPHSATDYGLIFGYFFYLQIIRVFLFMVFLPLLSWRNKWLTWKEDLVVGLSGLRGAVSLILALNVAGAGPIDVGVRSRVVLWTAGIIALSLIVNGLMIPKILAWLKLDGADKTREDFLRKARATMTQHTLGVLDTLCVDIGYKAARWSYVLENVLPTMWLEDDMYGKEFASAAQNIYGNTHTHRLSLEFIHSEARRASTNAEMRARNSSEMFAAAPGSQQPHRVSLSHAPPTSIHAPPYSPRQKKGSPGSSKAMSATSSQPSKLALPPLSDRMIRGSMVSSVSPVYEPGHNRRSLEFDINRYDPSGGEKWSKRIHTELAALRGKQIDAQYLDDEEADYDTAHDREVRRRMLMSMLSQVRALSNATLIEYSALVSLEEDVQTALDANDEHDEYDLFSKLDRQSLYAQVFSKCIDEKKFSGETIVAASAVFSILTEILKQEQINASKRVRREAEQLYEGAAYLLNRLETFNPKAFRWVHSQFAVHMTTAKQDSALEDMMSGGVIDAYEHKVLRRELVGVRRRHAIHARQVWKKQKKTARDLLPFHPMFVDKLAMFKELTSQPVVNLSPGHRLRLERGTLILVMEGALRPVGYEYMGSPETDQAGNMGEQNQSSTSGSGSLPKAEEQPKLAGGGGSAYHWCFNQFSGFCGGSLTCAINNEEEGEMCSVAAARVKETNYIACDIAETTTVFTMPADMVERTAAQSKAFRDELTRALAREIVLDSVADQSTHHLRQINEALSNSINEHTVIGRAFRILQRLPYMKVIRLHAGEKVGPGADPLQTTLQGPGVLINGVVRVSIVDTSGLAGAANLLHERLEGPALLPAGGLIIQEVASDNDSDDSGSNRPGNRDEVSADGAAPSAENLGPVLAHVLVEEDTGLEGGARARIERWTADPNTIDMNGRFGMYRHITNCAHPTPDHNQRSDHVATRSESGFGGSMV